MELGIRDENMGGNRGDCNISNGKMAMGVFKGEI